MTVNWRLDSSKPGLHIALLLCVLSEVILLEVLRNLTLFYCANIVIIFCYAYCISQFTHEKWIAAAIAGSGLTALTFHLLWGVAMRIPTSLCWFLMHATIATALTVRVFLLQTIRIQEIIDAVTIFLVAGMVFVNLYYIALIFDPLGLTSTIAPDKPLDFSSIIYYSYIMQLTVGDGAVLARNNIIRAISVLQALFGVLYLTILVARFVSIYTATATIKQRTGQ